MRRKENYMGEIVDYIKKNMNKGYTMESLKWALIQQGYSKLEIEKAMLTVNKDLAKSAPILETKPQITHEVIPVEMPQDDKKPFWKKLFGG